MGTVLIIVVVLAAVGAIGFVLTNASKEKREVLNRLERERAIRPDYSPTAELFRSAGASETEVEQVAPTPPPTVPTRNAPKEAAAAVSGPPLVAGRVSASVPVALRNVTLPVDFVPVERGSSARAVFSVERSATMVRNHLDHLLGEAGASITWLEPNIASIAHQSETALITLIPEASTATDLDGSPLYPDVPAGETVVRITAI